MQLVPGLPRSQFLVPLKEERDERSTHRHFILRFFLPLASDFFSRSLPLEKTLEKAHFIHDVSISFNTGRDGRVVILHLLRSNRFA